MSVVAEGIETQGQLDKVTALQSDFGQGYLFARPLVADEAEEIINEAPWVQESETADVLAMKA